MYRKNLFCKSVIGFVFVCLFLISLNTDAQSIVVPVLAIEKEQQSAVWQRALETRMSVSERDSLAALHRPLSLAESGWFKLIGEEAAQWNIWRDSLNQLFPSVSAADSIIVLLGFLGSDDGFTYGFNTVCLDLTALYSQYGAATEPGNRDRAGRIFAHEYTHLLQKIWMRDQQWQPQTFADSIIWECWYEGIGMYRSLSKFWQPVNGKLPEASRLLLQELEPVLQNHLAQMNRQNLSTEEKAAIRKNLSRGPVRKKWGASCIALYLMLAADEDQLLLPKIVRMGPTMIGYLIGRYGNRQLTESRDKDTGNGN